jgi:uroporphyrin-3 C-methyltransferase
VSEPLSPSVESVESFDALVPASETPVAVRAFWPKLLLGMMVLLVVVSLVLAWATQQRVRQIEQELVRRQQDSQMRAGEARMLAKQAQEGSVEATAKVALLEARLAEVAVQRTQLEDVIQALSRSRDDNILVDLDALLRVAQQQSALTGSAEPLVSALKQADDRLARHNQPRLERVRRAIARDLDRVKAVGAADVAALSLKLDEVARLVDELPLLSQALPRAESASAAKQPAGARVIASAASAPASAASTPVASSAPTGWTHLLAQGWTDSVNRVWDETRALVRVTRIDHPEAMLLAPDQAFFLRENLKLRLLNARLALLSRQFDTAKADLLEASTMIERYFDRNARRTGVANELVKQVAAAAPRAGVPRPDETLAALQAASAGR